MNRCFPFLAVNIYHPIGKEENIMEKKIYETPEVTKVEFDISDRITASACSTGAIAFSVNCNNMDF